MVYVIHARNSEMKEKYKTKKIYFNFMLMFYLVFNAFLALLFYSLFRDQ